MRSKQGGVIPEKETKDTPAFWRDFLIELLLALVAVTLGKLVKLGLDSLKRLLIKDRP